MQYIKLSNSIGCDKINRLLSSLEGGIIRKMKVWKNKKVFAFLCSIVLLMSVQVPVGATVTVETTAVQPTEKITNRKKTLFIVGDSTSKSYHEKDTKTYPREGWGQEIFHNFKEANQCVRNDIKVKGDSGAVQYTLPNMNIESWGKAGATIKTCYDSGRFGTLLKRVQARDYVMIQFGHNDGRKSLGEPVSQYKKYLDDMVRKIKNKKAVPVLITPSTVYSSKRVKLNVPAYRTAMIKTAKKNHVAYIDLNQECVDYFNLRGPKTTKKWYMFLPPNQYASYPKGLKDTTHFRRAGASIIARIISVKVQNNRRLKPLAQELDLNSKGLYGTLHKARKNKKRGNYTKKSWNHMVQTRKSAWITMYSPNKSKEECKRTNQRLKRAIKSLKRK